MSMLPYRTRKRQSYKPANARHSRIPAVDTPLPFSRRIALDRCRELNRRAVVPPEREV
jgi:hypothetical protein